jgi:ribosomal protein S28E/S33
LDSEGIIIESEYPKTADAIVVNVTVYNDGQVDGLTSVRVEVIEDGDKRRLIEIVNIEVPANSYASFEAKWVPEDEGASWIEISTPDGKFARTNPIQVESGESTFVIESLEGASGAMLTGFAVITFAMIGLLGFLVVSGKKPQDDDFEDSEFA